MRVLVIGSGGREHALVWKLAQSPHVEKIFTTPGNPGTASLGQNTSISGDDLEGLKNFALEEKIDLTVVGPEAPLVLGIVDAFNASGLKIFGPSKQAALLEGSKHFAKTFMKEFSIPTADSETFDNIQEARRYLKKTGLPIVIKADGLAAGKGVTVALNETMAEQALRECFEEKFFGDAGARVVIEEYLEGEEVSVLAVADGKSFVLLPSSQDHKAVYDGDQGPNTGGMGAYSPAPVFTPEVQQFVNDKVISPTIKGMAERGTPYIGVLYAGMMITQKGPKVLEFNCRMGDPETQAVLPRIESDFLELLDAASQGRIQEAPPLQIASSACVCVVMASGGYPASFEKGKVISGIEEAEQNDQVVVFHAGTKINSDGKLVTSGGRVLGVTGRGASIQAAIDCAYKGVDRIHFEGMHYRKDIGKKALRHLS